jgi:hypothetical protein
VQSSNSSLVGDATLVVANVPTCNLDSPIAEAQAPSDSGPLAWPQFGQTASSFVICTEFDHVYDHASVMQNAG